MGRTFNFCGSDYKIKIRAYFDEWDYTTVTVVCIVTPIIQVDNKIILGVNTEEYSYTGCNTDENIDKAIEEAIKEYKKHRVNEFMYNNEIERKNLFDVEQRLSYLIQYKNEIIKSKPKIMKEYKIKSIDKRINDLVERRVYLLKVIDKYNELCRIGLTQLG